MYGFVCAYGGECGQAEEAARRAVELDSESYLARFALGEVLRVNGKFEESVATSELALAISGRHAWAIVFLAVALADWGKPAEAEALYVEMLARARRQYMPPAILALVAAAAAREDDAIHHAGDAFKIRDPECLFVLSRHGLIATRLYAYPRFRELLSEMGFE
jgi:tetratricopeptide (TPR) repeat protein